MCQSDCRAKKLNRTTALSQIAHSQLDQHHCAGLCNHFANGNDAQPLGTLPHVSMTQCSGSQVHRRHTGLDSTGMDKCETMRQLFLRAHVHAETLFVFFHTQNLGNRVTELGEGTRASCSWAKSAHLRITCPMAGDDKKSSKRGCLAHPVQKTR